MKDVPRIFGRSAGLVAAQSTRLGGVSAYPYQSLNLGLSVRDKKENVLCNRRLFFSSLGISESQVASSGQVHGKEILVADSPGRREGYDAIITNTKNLFVAVSIADCCPVLVYDSRNNAVAAVHAGWRGTAAQITAAALEKMNAEFGTEAKNCLAYIGTCIAECAFEVGEEVAAKFDPCFVSRGEKEGKYRVDLKRASLRQLMDFGIKESQVEISPHCTVMNNDRYFSYRKEGAESGRMLAIIGLKSS